MIIFWKGKKIIVGNFWKKKLACAEHWASMISFFPSNKSSGLFLYPNYSEPRGIPERSGTVSPSPAAACCRNATSFLKLPPGFGLANSKRRNKLRTWHFQSKIKQLFCDISGVSLSEGESLAGKLPRRETIVDGGASLQSPSVNKTWVQVSSGNTQKCKQESPKWQISACD